MTNLAGLRRTLLNVLTELEAGAVGETELADGAVTDQKVAADAAIDPAKVDTLAGDVAGPGDALVLQPGVVKDSHVVATADIDPAKILGEALVKTTVFGGDVSGTWNALSLGSGVVGNDELDTIRWKAIHFNGSPPASSSAAAQPYTIGIDVDGGRLYVCYEANSFGAGVNWLRSGIGGTFVSF